MPMPIVRFYILRIFAKFFALALFVFVSLLLILNLVQIVNQGVLSGVSFYLLSRSVLYMLPNVVGMSLPLAFLLALLLSLGQMSQDGEILALRAGGFSFYGIFSCIFWAAILAVLLLIGINNWAGPAGLRRSTDYTISMLNRVSRIELKPRTFQKLSDWVLYASEVNNLSGALRGVKLVRRFDKGAAPSFVTRITAAEGHYRIAGDNGIELELGGGQFAHTNYKDTEKILYGDFTSYRTMLSFFPDGAAGRKLNQHEISTPGLIARLRAGISDEQLALRYRIEAASRFALALSPLVFFLAGAPLGVVLDKRGRSAGFAVSLLIMFFYYGLTVTAMVMSKKYPVLFPWAVFVPAVLTGAAGMWLWKVKLYGK